MNKGLTLIEVVVSLAILTVVAVVVMSSTLHAYDIYNRGKQNSETVENLVNSFESRDDVSEFARLEPPKNAELSFTLSAIDTSGDESAPTEINIDGSLRSSYLKVSEPADADDFHSKLEITEFISN